MVSGWNNSWGYEELTEKHFKYAYRRVEQRYVNSVKEVPKHRVIEIEANRISIGTFTILPPKPDTQLKSFTLALAKDVPESELYPKLKEVFGDDWNGKPTKSVLVRLNRPIKMAALRDKIEGLSL